MRVCLTTKEIKIIIANLKITEPVTEDKVTLISYLEEVLRKANAD